jgi:integrase
MTRIKLPYIHEFIGRHGEIRRYFRRHGKRVPLPGLPGSEEFMEAYKAAMQHQPVAANRTKPGSVDAAIVGYYTSLEFRALAPGTQGARRAILERFRESNGQKSIATLPPKWIAMTLSKMKPAAARNWLKALRGLTQFCVAQEFIVTDPTLGVQLPPLKSDGHHTWSEAEIARYEATHPIGTKARLGMALTLYSGQRVSDVVRMGPQHVSNGTIAVRQQKTKTPLRIPIHPRLQAVLDATPSKHLTFLITKNDEPYQPSGFSRQFREWCNEAGLPLACVPHGLRKAARRRLAEAGCSASQIAAISGHKSLKEVERYVREADQEHMAKSALARVLRTERELKSGNPDPLKLATSFKSLDKNA